MDGYELTGAIRDMEKGSNRRLPIIAVTANALQGEAERCLAAGMDDYISKPIAMPALAAALKKWMPPPREGNAVPDATPQGAPAASAPPSAAPPAATSAATSAPKDGVIDERALKDTFGDDDAVFKEILMSFLEPSEDIIADIVAAWGDRNAVAVKEAAHKLKSSARSIGANALADTCQALEAAGKVGDFTTIDMLAPAARDQFGDVKLYINALAAVE
jgi:HPt (histidine-containing phosphotransfer) domain-containing protein